MASAIPTYLFLLSLCLSVHARLAVAAAAPASGTLASACKRTPFPETCTRALGPRIRQYPQGTAPGAPGRVNIVSLADKAIQAAEEAGTVASAAFLGRLAWFNTTVPDFKKCQSNCTVTIRDAMTKLRSARASLRAREYDEAADAVSAAINDVNSCSYSCKELSTGVRVIVDQSLSEFEKLLRIAVAFMRILTGFV